MSLPLSQPASSTASSSAPAFDARLLRLHSVFGHLDSISPDHPASQSITLPKLKEALTTYSNYTFTSLNTSAGTQPSLLDKRRRRIAEEERVVQDMLDAVDVTRNGRIEFNEFLQMMDSVKADNNNQQHTDDDDDEWTPTKDVSI